MADKENGKMAVYTETKTYHTKAHMGMIDVTEDFQHAVSQACKKHGISSGIITGFTTGGVAGLNLYPDFLGENATLDTVCDHALHWLELGGAKHIALGGDLDGVEALPAGFTGVQDYAKLAEQLLARGVSEPVVYDIFWNNAMGVMEKCCL
jgi:hypothetical protein